MDRTQSAWWIKWAGAAGAALLAAALCLAPPAQASRPRPIMVAINSDLEHSLHAVWIDLIYRDAFGRLGYELTLRAFPSKRASAMVDNGELDGEVHRVASYGEAHPALVRLAEPHFGGVFSAYAVADLNLKTGWSGLLNTGYRVEHRAGSYHPQRELRKVLPPEQLSAVSSTMLGLRKLVAGRTDLFVDNEGVVNQALENEEFRTAGIHRVAVLEKVDAYLFLHAKHRELAPRLSAVLAGMKKDGSIERHRLQAAALLQQLKDKTASAAP